MKNKKIALLFALALIGALITGGVIANIFFTKEYQASVTISTVTGLEVLWEADNSTVTTINFGNISNTKENTKTTANINLVNTGNIIIYPAWDNSSMPNGITITGEYFNINEQYWKNMAKGWNTEHYIIPKSPLTIRFTITVQPYLHGGTFNWSIFIYGADTPTG